MLRDTLLSQYAPTHQIWNSYLKEYRRYVPDRKPDGLKDGQRNGKKQILYASHSSFGGIKTVLLKKAELMIAANPVCILGCRIDGTTESKMVAYTHKYAKV